MPKTTSPVDRLGKDETGHPDYSWFGRYGDQLKNDLPQLTRRGQSGMPHVDIEGQFNYGKPAAGTKPKPIVDPTGKTIKVGDDPHGLLGAIQSASQRARVPVPQHVMVLMANGANEEAERRVGDHRAHIERGTKGKARDEAKNQVSTAPFMAILRIGEQHLHGPHLRRFANALAGEFRDGASHTLPDGSESPIPLPLASLARHYLTADERRSGTELADILPDVDKQFHAGLKRHARLADTASRNVHDVTALQAAAQSRADLKTLGAHHTAALAQTRKQTRDEDAKAPAGEREQKARDYAAKVDAESDTNMAPMSDEELKNFQAVVSRLVADPDQFTEVSALPNASQGGAHHTAARVHIVRALEEAAGREAGKTPDQRQPLEVLLAHTLVTGLGPRAHGQITRAQKEGDPKTFHALAHRDMKADRHAIARAIVEGYHDTPEKSLCALLHIDPFRVARRIVGTLPGPDDMLRTLTEQGVITPKATDAKGKQRKGGASASQSGSQSNGQSQPTIPPLILPADRVQKASVWDDPGWEATRGRDRRGRPTSSVPTVRMTGQGARRGAYRPLFGADDAPIVPPDALDGDPLNPTPTANLFGRLPQKDLSQQMREARARFQNLHDKYRDGKADHMREMIQHGSELLHGPMSDMRERMNTIGGPDLTQRFLSHYAAHPNTTFDAANPDKHFEDHVGQSAGRAIADHLLDRHLQARANAAQDRYAAARANSATPNDQDAEIAEINRKYRAMQRANPNNRSAFVQSVRDHTRQAEINDAIRNRYLNDPKRRDISGATNLARGHMDVLAQSRGPLGQLFGHVGGHVMDSWQRHLDLRRAHQSAMRATKAHMRMLTDKANNEQAASAPLPASAPAASVSPAAAATPPAASSRPPLLDADDAVSPTIATPPRPMGRVPLRPRTNTGFAPRSASTAAAASPMLAPDNAPDFTATDDDTDPQARAHLLDYVEQATHQPEPAPDPAPDDVVDAPPTVPSVTPKSRRTRAPNVAAAPPPDAVAPVAAPTAPPLPVPPITQEDPVAEDDGPLTGDAAREAIGQSEDVATHAKLGAYLLHPHGEGYRISRHPDGDEDRLLPVKGHGVFPTKEEALARFGEDKGGISKYTMTHPFFDQGDDGITAAPPRPDPAIMPAVDRPRAAAPKAPTITPAPKRQDDLAAMNARLNPPVSAGSTPSRSSGKAYSVKDLLGKSLADGAAVPLLSFDRDPRY